MRPFIFLIMLLFTAISANAQQVVATSGNSGTAAGYTVDWTLGEPVIETISGSTHILTQGMHQTKLLVTAISEMEFPGLEVKVYPNPTGRFLKIEVIQTSNELLIYEIFDITGRKTAFKKMNLNSEEIDMESYVPGIYILTITTPNRDYVKTFKIIKK